MLAADAPTVADWMQGWGSLAGVFTSLVAIIFTGMLLRHEIRARRKDEAEASIAQARLVRLTIDICQRDASPQYANVPDGSTFLKATVANHSILPVFGILLCPPDNYKLHLAEDDDTGLGYHDVESLLPGTSTEAFYWLEVDESHLRTSVHSEVIFTDAAGATWRIHSHGTPERRATAPESRGIFTASLAIFARWAPIRWVRTRYWSVRNSINARAMTVEEAEIARIDEILRAMPPARRYRNRR